MPTTAATMSRKTQYIGDPLIIDGDLVKRGGDYERVCGIENMITILVGTNSGYWANLIEPTASRIPGGLEKLEGEAITSSFLDRHSAAVEVALAPLIANKIAKSITVESFNPEGDRIEWKAEIVLTDGSLYYYQSDKGAC
jgi:phage gp46-like protein